MKRAIVTGATSGIGEACAINLAKEGYNLVITGRRSGRLSLLAQKLKEDYEIEVEILCFDVRNKEEVEQAFDGLPNEWKTGLDVLVNNAGLSLGLVPINEGDWDDWDTMIDTNVKGLLYVSKVVSKWMVNNQRGHIVNIGSIAGKEVYANGNVYCATKHTVDALSKAMRVDLLPHNIRVTALHPGAVETEFSIVRFKGDEARAKKVYEGFEPLIAQDIADVLSFVVSRPAHININDILVMPTAQANSYTFNRK